MGDWVALGIYSICFSTTVLRICVCPDRYHLLKSVMASVHSPFHLLITDLIREIKPLMSRDRAAGMVRLDVVAPNQRR